MNNKKSQAGSAHLVIIILLAVALMGALGFVCYQNFIQPKVTNKLTDTTKITEINKTANGQNNGPSEITDNSTLTEVAYDKTMGTKFAIKYPNTWKLTYENPNDEVMGMSDINTVTSPDGKASVTLSIGRYSGLAGPCGGSRTSIEILDTGTIAGVPNTHFVNYKDTGTPYSFIGASTAGDPLGKIECSSYAEGNYLLGVGENIPAVALSAKVPDAIKSENYIIAKQIIQSLYKKD